MGPIASTLMVADAAVTTPLLPIAVLAPVVGAILVALIPRTRSELAKPVALLASFTTAAVVGWMLADFDYTGERAADFQFLSEQDWIQELGIQWLAGVDGISLFLVVMTAFLFPLAMLAVNPDSDPKAYYAWLLVLQTGCLGVFVALDLFMFFVFFEIVLIPMYFLIGKWGHGNREHAAMKFFLYTMLGSAFMLVGIVSLVWLNASAPGQELTFNLVEIAEAQSLATTTARWIFLSFAIAFAVKVPLFPVHTWLPDAHTEAPTAASVILAGVMLKLGTYGFLRFGLYLFPEASSYFAPLFLTLGVVGIVYGAVVATMQRDLKRLVAYSSIAHLGFIILGLFALNTEGIEGGVLQMVNHGISTGALFLLVGFIYERRHTRQISELGGLQKAAPILAAVFMVVMLSSIGLPGLNGFVGEFLILMGTFVSARWWAVVAATGVILAALYMLWAYQRVFHGEPEGDNATMADLGWKEGLIMAPLIILIVGMGVYPRPFLERVEPAVDALVEHIEVHVDGFEEPVTEGSGGGGFDDIEEHEDTHSEEEGDG
jgi:NADH-quinone oxidoreductase subunit M